MEPSCDAAPAPSTSTMNSRRFICDPRSPRQRGSNENTNRLLRQYLHLPRGTDLSLHSQAKLSSTKDRERPCSIKPQQTSSRNVLQRSVEPTARSGRSYASRASEFETDKERVESLSVVPQMRALRQFVAFVRRMRSRPDQRLLLQPIQAKSLTPVDEARPDIASTIRRFESFRPPPKPALP
jgi:hypothetical protein